MLENPVPSDSILIVLVLFMMFGAPVFTWWWVYRHCYHIFKKEVLPLLEGRAVSYDVGEFYRGDRIKFYWPQCDYLDRMFKEGLLELAQGSPTPDVGWPIYRLSDKGRKEAGLVATI